MIGHSYVVVANQSNAKIYALREHATVLELKHSLSNMYGRSQDQDIYTDRPGARSGASGYTHGKDATSRKNAVAVEAERFAGDIVEWLDSKRKTGKIYHVDIIAEPQFLGKLRHKMSKPLAECVEAEVHKDVIEASPEEVLEYLRRAH